MVNGRLLIIEVDNVFRQNLAQRMKLESYGVYCSRELSEILQILKRKHIDVVLLSLVELREKGLEFYKAIKKQSPAVEVILINQSEAMTLSIKGMKLGAFDDFFLPLEMHELLSRIEEAVKRKRQQKKVRKPILKRYEEMMIAITMAEAGSTDMAQKYLNRDKNNSSVNKSAQDSDDQAQ